MRQLNRFRQIFESLDGLDMKLAPKILLEHNPKRFVTTFALGLLSLLGAVALLNFIVNPLAQYPTSCFEPMAQTSRSKKLHLFDQLEHRPEGLILGSSRVMKLEPDYLKQLTGKSFFNAGVNYGTPDDHLAWLRLYEERHHRLPDIVIVGIDPSTFSKNLPVDARLINNRELGGQVPEAITWRDRSKLWEDLISWDQTKKSIKSLGMQSLGRNLPEPVEHYRPDGLLVYDKREREIREGTYDLQAGIDYNKSEYFPRYLQFGDHSKLRYVLFRELARLCQTNDTELYVFITPMHPELEAHLNSKTDYRKWRDETASHLNSLSTKYGYRFFDFAKLESFEGNPYQFIDGTHPLESNTRQIIDRMISRPGVTESPSTQQTAPTESVKLSGGLSLN